VGSDVASVVVVVVVVVGGGGGKGVWYPHHWYWQKSQQ